MIYKCLECGKEFKARPSRNRKTCSVACAGKRSRKKVFTKCGNCGKEIITTKSRLNTKSGLNFCSRECKEYAQSLRGGNISELQPSQYKNGKFVYRVWAFNELSNKCADCGIDTKYLLVVHHRDGDRDNNTIENLEIVCHNCHAKRHLMKTKNGLVYNPKVLTNMGRK